MNLQAVVEPPLFAPESTKALEMLRRFKESRTHFALVVDEHGSVVGICTLFDIMEAIVGALPTREEPKEALIVQRHDDSWLVDGALPFEDFKEHFRVAGFPEEKTGGYRTVGGFVMHVLHRVPAEGDYVEFSDLRVEVVDMDGRRVDKVLVRCLRVGTNKREK